MIISHIGVHTFYYDTRTLFPSTNSKIYNTEKPKQVKVIIFNKPALDTNVFLFDPTVPNIGHM